MRLADLDDRSGCPLATTCATCGAGSIAGLRVVTVGFDTLGVGCLTLCGWCTTTAELPETATTTAARAILDHCTHLGITADDMAAVVDRALRGDWDDDQGGLDEGEDH